MIQFDSCYLDELQRIGKYSIHGGCYKPWVVNAAIGCSWSDAVGLKT